MPNRGWNTLANSKQFLREVVQKTSCSAVDGMPRLCNTRKAYSRLLLHNVIWLVMWSDTIGGSLMMMPRTLRLLTSRCWNMAHGVAGMVPFFAHALKSEDEFFRLCAVKLQAVVWCPGFYVRYFVHTWSTVVCQNDQIKCHQRTWSYAYSWLLDSVQLILTHKSILMQWLHETMFVIVIFKICCQLLGASPQTTTGDPGTPGPH